MARIINSNITPHLKCNIKTVFENGNMDVVSYEKGDTVRNMRYVSGEEVKTVSGIIKEINILTVSKQKVSTIATNTFATDVKIVSLVIDASTEFNSDIVTVPAKEIVENEGVTDVKRMIVEPSLTATMSMEYTDGTTDTEELIPGNMLNDVVVLNTMSEISGDYMILAFGYTVKASELTITSILLKNHTRVLTASIKNIIKIGDSVQIAVDAVVVADAITSTTANICVMSDLDYTSTITLAKKFTLIGANYGIGAKNGKRATNDYIEGESTLSGTVTLSTNAVIELDGLTLAKDAHLVIDNASEVHIKNCRFIDVNPTTSKSFLIQGMEKENTLLLQIEDCYFGEKNPSATGQIYNLIEMTAILKDGSYIKNCHFAKSCTKNNVFPIYNVENGATIEVSNNLFEYSANAVRVGIKKEPECTINLLNNTYIETDYRTQYAGLLIVQPYVTETTSMKNCTINISGTTKCDGQLYYLYAGSGDMQFTEENKPTIYVDGVLQDLSE